MKDMLLSQEPEEPPSSISAFHQKAAPLSFQFPPELSIPGKVTTPPISDQPKVPRLTVSERSHVFRKKFYPQITTREWNDWRWQNRNRLTSLSAVARVLELSDDERSALQAHRGSLPVGMTPYYASLLDPKDPNQGLRRTVLPSMAEFVRMPGEADDPLGEDGHSPVPGLVHRYPDRVLFLVSNFCTTYCRYCTRSRMVGSSDADRAVTKTQWEKSIAYIQAHPEVRDVLISGGDPLSLSDERLEWLLSRLRAIPHVEFIRIGTKIPTVLPQRITPALVRMLRRFHPLWMSIHFTHPDEITAEVVEACERLADAGIPLGSQTVLLKGVNDSVETMKSLVHNLLKIRVRPYYLYQCDPITGSGQFRTPVSKGLEIIKGLRGHTTGYAVPSFVIDAPGGGGKIPLLPEYVAGRDGDDLLLVNFEGKQYRYPDPLGSETVQPAGRTSSPHQEGVTSCASA